MVAAAGNAPHSRRIRVGVVVYGDLTHDSRVRREATALALAGYDVAIACLAADTGSTDLPEEVRLLVRRPAAGSVIPGTPSPFIDGHRGRVRRLADRLRWLIGYVRTLRSWGRMAAAACGPVDVWHVHDLTGLAAVARLIPPSHPIVYDAHELFLETGTARRLPAPARAMLRRYERRLVRRTAGVVTVNQELATVLRRRYSPSRIEVVHNCPPRWDAPARTPTLIRDATGIPGDAFVILYHGALSAHRGVEQLMEALLQPGLEAAHLALLGFGELRDRYVELAAAPRWAGRVHVLDPVRPADLVPWVASADVGAMPIQASTLNHLLSTPNKLFECLTAGIPVVASDFPAMRAIVANEPDGSLGAVCDPADVGAIAAALRSIRDLDVVELSAMKARCRAAADTRWNWETESARLVSLFAAIAGHPA